MEDRLEARYWLLLKTRKHLAGLKILALHKERAGKRATAGTVDAGRTEDVLRTGAVEAAHLGSEGEVSAEA